MIGSATSKAELVRRYIRVTALSATIALAVAAPASARSLPDGYGPLPYETDSLEYGKVDFEHRLLEGTTYAFAWSFDGVPATGIIRQEQTIVSLDGQQHTYTVGEFSAKALDGKEHVVVLLLTDLGSGKVYRSMAKWRAPLPMTATAPVQSARIAAKRGILVRVTGAKGFYRASTTSKKIPGSGNARITAVDGGSAAIRIKGSYMNRLRPGQTIHLEARHLQRNWSIETAKFTVQLR